MFVRLVTASALLVGIAAVGPGLYATLFGAPHWQRSATAENDEPMAAVALAPAIEAPARDRHGATGSGRAAIYAGPDGHFRAEARVRGRAVPVVIDTGATVVALNAGTARQLGVAPSAGAPRVKIVTANGPVQGAAVVLPDVVLGGVRVNNVQAVVLPDNALDTTLLGMSFLGRLKEWKAGSGRLELVQ